MALQFLICINGAFECIRGGGVKLVPYFRQLQDEENAVAEISIWSGEWYIQLKMVLNLLQGFTEKHCALHCNINVTSAVACYLSLRKK